MARERGGGLGKGAALLGDGRGGDRLAVAEEVLAGGFLEELETSPIEVDFGWRRPALRNLAVAALQTLAIPEETGVAVESLGGGPREEVPLQETEIAIGERLTPKVEMDILPGES